jgi:hypothetical protein
MAKGQKQSRAMKDISLDERREILIDCTLMTARDVQEKWNITNNVLNHIRFFHGKSSAKAGGYYHKDLLEGATDPRIDRLTELKLAGLNSLEASIDTGVPLPQVNKLWSKLGITI